MRIKNSKISREVSALNGFSICISAAAALVFAIVTLIFGTDGDVYGEHIFPKLFVSMFCYSLIFSSHMLFLGAYVGINIGDCFGIRKIEELIYGISAIVCEAAAIPLMFQTTAFFYAFLLKLSSMCFFLLITMRMCRDNGITTLLAILCGVGASYQIYISFSLMLLN